MVIFSHRYLDSDPSEHHCATQTSKLFVSHLIYLSHSHKGHYLSAVCLDNLGEFGPAISAFLRALKHDQDHQAQLVDNVAVVAANICHFSDEVLQKLDSKFKFRHCFFVR